MFPLLLFSRLSFRLCYSVFSTLLLILLFFSLSCFLFSFSHFFFFAIHSTQLFAPVLFPFTAFSFFYFILSCRVTITHIPLSIISLSLRSLSSNSTHHRRLPFLSDSLLTFFPSHFYQYFFLSSFLFFFQRLFSHLPYFYCLFDKIHIDVFTYVIFVFLSHFKPLSLLPFSIYLFLWV